MQYIYYSIAFYGLIFLLLMVQKNNQKVLQDTKKISISSIVILFLFLLVRVWLASFSSGHPYDIKCFSLWAQKLADVGPSEFYAPDYFADYPPGYMLVLYVLGLIGKLFNIPPLSSSYSLLIKIPAILADLALGLMVYHIAKINLKEKMKI